MKTLRDTVWQRRGVSWLWDAEALSKITKAQEVWSMRQFLLSVERWSEDLPSNNGKTLVVAGLEGCLDILTPHEAENWLADHVKTAILSFQDFWEGQAALVFWLPGATGRLITNPATDAVAWRCAAPQSHTNMDFGRILWGEANEYPQEILLERATKTSGLFHLRIT
jgi:hypothetical protein